MESPLLAGLNAAQKAAVTSTAPVLQVLAPPGSGKTKTLTSRVAYLLSHHGYNPQNVICCTFTIKASREMRERLRGLVGQELESKLILGTFHSICRRYLVAYGNLIGIPKTFGIADTSDSTSIIKRIIKKSNYTIDHKVARSRISSHKAKGKTLEDLSKNPPKQIDRQEFVAVFHEYETALATSNLLDYDDLLLRCVDLLRAHPSCVGNIEALLIDEFQDTNIVQFELMKLLASANKRITIVGDPDQSIYGFRSAEIENLQRMKAFYPLTNVINLEENYRSSSAILRLAQEVIEQDDQRPDKRLKATHCYGTLPVLRRLPNPHEEALWITSEIKRFVAMTGGLVRHSDIAILLRSAYLSLLIEKAFTSSAIPYRMVGGQRFFDRAEIRLVVDYLRTISHPENNPAFLAIINVPSRKIGETTITALVNLCETKGLPLFTVVQKVLAGGLHLDKKLSNPAEQDLHKLINFIKTARQKMSSTTPARVPSKLIEYIVSSLDLQNYMKKKYKDDHEDRIENIKELITHASEVAALPNAEDQLPDVSGVQKQDMEAGQEVLSQFLANIVLSTEVESSDKGEDKPRVTISTIHSAKGLEWPIVFVPAAYNGSIPHSRAEDINEERRLLYVAMTRAQVLLTLTFPVMQSREQGESILTQFLPKEVHSRLAQTGPLFSDKTVVDIAQILRRDAPSQEDLARSLLALTEGESATDDVWPDDGSRRVLVSNFNSGSFQSTNVPCAGVTTTMSSTANFSTANMSLGFTTANHQLKQAPPVLIHSNSDPSSIKNKPKLTKSTSAHGNITSFFSQNPPPTSVDPLPVSSLQPSHRHPNLSVPPPRVPTVGRPVESSIPKDLSAHRIGRLATTGLKRPRPALEETSPNRTRYTFLSSSPPRELEPSNSAATTISNRTTTAIGKTPAAFVGATMQRSTITTQPHILPIPNVTTTQANIPATTMHVTSMSLLKQNVYETGKRTLGVRRSMNGWNERKHK